MKSNRVITDILYNNSDPNGKIKGTKNIKVLFAGDTEDGDASLSSSEYMPFYKGEIFRGNITIPKRIHHQSIRYPHDGNVSTGDILQLTFPNMKVIPYQAGRGVPVGKSLFVTDTDIEYEEGLSMGTVQGNNDICIGVALNDATSGNKVQVLENGSVTVRIGASSNVATQYKSNGTPVIPLFEGESLRLGSQVYATCMGVEIVPQPEENSPYPLVSYVDANGVLHYNADDRILEPLGSQMDARRLNPYYDYFDSTFGNCGYTSTPFSNGTVIVRCDTISNNTSGRFNLLGLAEYTRDYQITNKGINWDRWSKITKIPHKPNRSLSIGYSKESISGTGNWPYTGSFSTDQPLPVSYGLGVNYIVDDLLSTETNGDGEGYFAKVTSVSSTGGILTFISLTVGNGYVAGDRLYLVNKEIDWGANTLTVHANSAIGEWDAPGSFYSSNYTTSIYCDTYNASLNNLCVEVTISEDLYKYHLKPTLIEPASISVSRITDYSRYKPGTRIGLINNNVHPDNWIVLEIETNNGVDTITFSIYRQGALSAYETGTKVYSTEILDYPSPKVRFTATDGEVDEGSVRLLTIPHSIHRDGDAILIKQKTSDMNRVFSLTRPTPTICRPIIGAKMMYDRALIEEVQYYSGGTGNTRTMDINEVNSNGQPSCLFWDHNRSDTLATSIDEVYEQDAQLNIHDHPGGFTEPNFLADTYVKRYLGYNSEPRLSFTNRGTGYTIGSESIVGSGSGGEIYITKVSDIGSILEYRMKTIDDSYSYNETVTIGVGSATAVLRHPRTRELETVWTTSNTFSEPAISSQTHFCPQLLWDVEIINGGSGYSVGNYDGISDDPVSPTRIHNVSFKVLTVNSGAVTEIEINRTGDPFLNVFTNYCFTLDGGSSDAIVRLIRPLPAKVPQLVPLRPSDGVAREGENLSTQLFIYVLGTPGGTIDPYVYDGTVKMYRDNPIDRYENGDSICILEGSNRSQVEQINNIDYGQGILEFTQTSAGTGYTLGDGDRAYMAGNHEVRGTYDVIDGKISINTLDSHSRFGDIILLDNCCFILTDEMDVPPQYQEEYNNREATQEEWDTYDAVLDSSINLLDQSLTINFQREHPDFYDNSYYFYGDPDNKDPNTVGWTTEDISA